MCASKSKIARNDPCSCGSAKKYKHCCCKRGDFILLPEKTNNISEHDARNRLLKKIKRRFITNAKAKGPLKMSEVILDLASDLLLSSETREQNEMAISLVCVVWNLAVSYPKDKLDIQVEKLLNKLNISSEQRKDLMRDVIYDLIHKRNQRYPNLMRFIAEYELTDASDEFLLTIASLGAEDEVRS